MAVKFKNNLLTGDQLRTYLVGLNPTIDLPVDLVPLMRESLFDGSLNLIMAQVNKLACVKELYIDNLFNSEIDLNDISSAPLVNSIYNYIDSSLIKIKDISDIKDPVETLEAISGIVLPDLDKLVLQVRDVQTRQVILDKV